MKRCCKDCEWWVTTHPSIHTPEGWCYRMPHTEPKNPGEWCGEFKPREEQKEKPKNSQEVVDNPPTAP